MPGSKKRGREKVLAEGSREVLAAAVELNSADRIRLEGSLPWVQFADDGDALRLFAGDTWPRNRVVLARFTSSNAKQRIKDILAPHQAQGVSCNWITGPVSTPPEIGIQLRAAGFRCMVHCAGMACTLERITSGPPIPKAVEVALVETVPSLVPPTTERRQRRDQGRNLIARLNQERVHCFSATADGLPVGETELFLGAGVAGIYNVEVLKPYRRRGIGSLLVYGALRHAKQLGYRIATLGATGMGQSLYEHFGFEEVGKVSFWKYPKTRSALGNLISCDPKPGT